MAVNQITPLPDPPSKSNPSNFAARADAFLGALPDAVTEMNAVIQEMNDYARLASASEGSGLTATSTTALTIAESGTVTLTIVAGKNFVAGQRVAIWNEAGSKGMAGRITSYSGSTLTVQVTDAVGSGNLANWTIFIIPSTHNFDDTPTGVELFFPPSTAAVLARTANTARHGLVELATGPETLAGTDNTRAVTPAGLAAILPNIPTVPPALTLPFDAMTNLPGSVNFTRASSGTRLSASGIIKTEALNVPRFDFNGNGEPLGLLVEGAAMRINTIAAAPTSPENIAVTAQAYTISFYGTGSMVLSGAHSATVVGTGAFPTRTSYTFTPSAGTLTLTPSGDVQHLQLEAGPFATSPILGEGSAVARAADVATVALSDIDFNAAEGTIYCEFRVAVVSVPQRIFYLNNNDNTNVLSLFVSAGNKITMAATSSGTATVYTAEASTIVANTMYKAAFSFKNDSYHLVVNGGQAVSNTSGAMPQPLTTLRLGQTLVGLQPLSGALRHFAYFPRALTDAQLQALTL